jgi:asparagine synthase (glutamine-hydrolysing)
MCGICGKINFGADRDRPVEPALIQRMTRVLEHRGPDDEGYYIRGCAGLGHRRLKIIDIVDGKQPMFNEDGCLVVVFNGEIYNFLELRRQLQAAGHIFKTRSDTEVLLHAYEQWHEDFLDRLRGMFAFAIWDDRKQQLFLARDRVGIKPLYYYWDERSFLFASEIKSILQDPMVGKKVDYCALDDYLTYLYIPAPKTIFSGIRKLKPGHSLMVTSRGLVERQYWDISFEQQNGLRESEYAEGLKEKLRESVSYHLISDVPLGAFLSGGLDSSAVVGFMDEVMKEPVNTASIGFNESAFDELPYARIIARKFNTNAHERIVEANAAKILDALVWHFDEPFADSSMVPTYYVSQIAREKVTVCLSGDGGDENFAGYRRYRFDVFENRIRAMLPGFIRRPFFGSLAKAYPKADWLPQIFRAKTLLTNLALGPEQAYFHTMSWFDPEMKRLLYKHHLKKALNGYESFSIMKEYFDRTEGWDPLSRIQYVDIKTYLVDDILTKVDRTSMAHALEVRVPMLDHQVMEYAASIPARYKLRSGEGKYIFKKTLAGLLPAEILNRPKMGFSIPLARWLRGDLKLVFEDHIFSKDTFLGSLFELDPVRRWWNQHQRGTRDYSYHLWALLILECWGERFMTK